jgi:hypothetical protein
MALQAGFEKYQGILRGRNMALEGWLKGRSRRHIAYEALESARRQPEQDAKDKFFLLEAQGLYLSFGGVNSIVEREAGEELMSQKLRKV